MSVIFYGHPVGGPVLPPEVPPPIVNPAPSDWEDIYSSLIDSEPPGLLPIDDGSYYARLRKTFAYQLGIILAQLNSAYENMTVDSARADLAEWEVEVGLPADPTGKTAEVRRALILARLRKGPFTRSARAAIVENFIQSTVGPATSFFVGGIVIDDAGITLYSGLDSTFGTYKIYEDIMNYSYVVRINSAIGVDAGLLRELQIYTPTGITPTLSSVTQVLDYALMMKSHHPVWWSRLGANANDASGYANNGSIVGTTSAVASPGLLNTDVAGGNGALTMTDGHINVPASAILNQLADKFSVGILFKPSTIDATARYLFSKAGVYHLTTNISNKLSLVNAATGNIIASVGGPFVAGTQYHIHVTYNNGRVKFFVNHVEQTHVDGPGIDEIIVPASVATFIGRKHDSTAPVLGVIDEPAIFDYELSQEIVDEEFNTALSTFV